jgi:hypothetical protein
MYLNYLKNNFILCSVFGIIAVIALFVDGRRNNEKHSLKKYGKIFGIVTISCYFVLYMKSNNILNVSTPDNTSLFSSAPWNTVSSAQSNAVGGGGVNLDNYNSINIGEPNF